MAVEFYRHSLGEEEKAAAASVLDTLFLTTRHPDRGVDVSHRGGRPGFAEWLDDRTLRLPDYPGNGLFQYLFSSARKPQGVSPAGRGGDQALPIPITRPTA